MGRDMGESNKSYSVELCGGTHVSRLGDIALLTVVGESAVASGIRRIEALTGEAARLYLDDQVNAARNAADIIKAAPGDLAERVSALMADRKKLEKELSDVKKKLALGGGASPADEVKSFGDIKFIGKVLDGVAAKELRNLVDQAKKSLGSGVAAFVAVNDGKAALTVGVTDDLMENFSAVDLVRVGATAIGGKGGGGRADMAQAGGPDGANAQAAITSIEEALSA